MSEQIPASRASRFDPLSGLWKLAAAPATLVVLLALIALVVALGTLIPQIPPEAAENPQTWLAAELGLSGLAGEVTRALRLYNVYHALWFHLLLMLAGVALFVRIVESAELAWRASRLREWRCEDLALWRAAESRASVFSALPPEDAVSRVGPLLTQQQYKWRELSTSSIQSFVAGRRVALLWAQPVTYGVLLAALIGLLLAGALGWQNGDWLPAPGTTRTVGHGEPLAVRLDSFGPPEGESADLRRYRSQITWLPEQGTPVSDVAAFGSPAKLHGIAVRQVGYVPVVTIRARDAAGARLALQVGGEEPPTVGAIEIPFGSVEEEPLVFAPSQGFFITLAFEPRCETGRPTLRVDLLKDGGEQRQTMGTLQGSGILAANGLEVETFLTFRPVLRVDHRPFMASVVGGMALAIVAVTIGWLLSPRLVWLALETNEEGGILLHVVVPPSLRTSRWPAILTQQLREVLADGD